MKNLKRVLSLAISGIMLIGMMATASAADFTDQEKIEHPDAVGILNALNVIKGKEDGSYFDPEGDVTRAEMAKMIAVTLNGGSEVATGVKGTATYTDIRGHWAEDFIEYCSSMGIVAGRGDGIFDPEGKVTGLEATKMVLTALGYDAEAYKLTGADWSVNTDELARRADPALYDGLTADKIAGNASRDTAAQLIWNGLQNTTRRVRPTVGLNTGSIEWTYEVGKTLLYERYNGQIWIGTFQGNDKNLGGLEDGAIRVFGKIEDDDKNGKKAADFPYDFDIDFIGEEVKVIFKDGVNGKKDTPDKKDTIYGVFLTGGTSVIRTTVKKIDKVKSDTQKSVLKVDGTEYDAYTVADPDTGKPVVQKVPVNFNYTGNNSFDSMNTDKDNESALYKELTGAKTVKGDAVKVVLNDSNQVTNVYVTTYRLGVVTAVSSSKVTINNGVGTIEKAKNDVYEDIAKGDVVVWTTLYQDKATKDGAYTIVEKAEKVSGELTAYKLNDKKTAAESIAVDGESYDVVKGGFLRTDLGSKAIDEKDMKDSYIDSEVDLYLLNGYAAAVVQTKANNTNYSVVIDISETKDASNYFNSLQLRVMDGKGVKSVITVSEDSEGRTDDDINHGDEECKGILCEHSYKIGDIITYNFNKDGEAEVTLEGKAAQVKFKYEKDNKSVTYDDKTYVTTGDCVLFVKTSLDDEAKTFKAYDIRSLKNVVGDGTIDATWVYKDAKVVAAYIELKQTPSGATNTKVYGVVSKVVGTVKVDGTVYYQYQIQVNGETYKVNLNTKANDSAKLAKGVIVGFEPTNDGIYDSNSKFEIVNAKVEEMVNAKEKAVATWVKEYVAEDDIITVYTEVDPYNKDDKKVATDSKDIAYWEGNDKTTMTYAVDEDVKIYYVDVDGSKSPESGSVTTMDTMTGYRNVILIVEPEVKDDKGNVVTVAKVVAIIAEVSGEGHIAKPAKKK